MKNTNEPHGRTATAFPGWLDRVDLDAISDALDARGTAHEIQGNHLRTDCPNCGDTGRRGRRPIVIAAIPRGLITEAGCGCQIVDIAESLSLPRNALLTYRVSTLPYGGEGDPGRSAGANHRGLTLAVTSIPPEPGRRNLRAVLRVAENLDARLADHRWHSIDSRGFAADIRLGRTSAQRALDWFVEHNVLAERQMPAPDRWVVTERGRKTKKSGVKQYRLLTEDEQIRRLGSRATSSG